MVKGQPCCVCGREGPSDPHHFLGSVHGLKSSDLYTVPLCRRCHDQIELRGELNGGMLEAWVHMVGGLAMAVFEQDL